MVQKKGSDLHLLGNQAKPLQRGLHRFVVSALSIEKRDDGGHESLRFGPHDLLRFQNERCHHTCGGNHRQIPATVHEEKGEILIEHGSEPVVRSGAKLLDGFTKLFDHFLQCQGGGKVAGEKRGTDGGGHWGFEKMIFLFFFFGFSSKEKF